MPFNENIPEFTVHTTNHADNFNEVNQILLENTKQNKQDIQSLSEQHGQDKIETDNKITELEAPCLISKDQTLPSSQRIQGKIYFKVKSEIVKTNMQGE